MKELLNKYTDHTAIITYEGRQHSYADLLSYSDELYSNINHRCLVFCLCHNSIGSLTGYVSFLSNNVVPLLLDASLNISLLRKLIALYNPEYIWLPEDKSANLENSNIVYSSNGYALAKLETDSVYADLYDELALLLTTSGSTGSPKLVRLSYDNVFSNAESIAEYLSIDENERPITSLPMHYSYGISIINSHLIKGSTILLTNKSIMEKEFWTLLKDEKATSIAGVPYTYEMLKRLRFFRMNLPYLKTLTQAGGKLNLELTKEFAEYAEANNKRFFIMYGQTEATARMSYLPYEKSLSKLGSIGIAIPGGHFELVDDNKKETKNCNVIGELAYKGPNVSLGYAEKREDLSNGDDNNGILYTGDLAKIDPEGYYYIVGRKKRFIKLYGNRINLDETEGLLKDLITDCACVGTDDKMVIYVTEQEREEEIRHYISSKTGIHFNAFTVRYINSIPKNSSGKTIYTELTL